MPLTPKYKRWSQTQLLTGLVGLLRWNIFFVCLIMIITFLLWAGIKESFFQGEDKDFRVSLAFEEEEKKSLYINKQKCEPLFNLFIGYNSVVLVIVKKKKKAV